MKEETDRQLAELRVDGGAAENDFLCQFQSDISSIPLLRTGIFESSALGAAYGAGLAVGVWDDLEELEGLIETRDNQRFEPEMEEEQRTELYEKWEEAVERAKNWVL